MEAIDNQYNFVDYCDIQKISELKKRAEWVRKAFDKGELTTEQRNNLDEFAWKILTEFEDRCVCKEYNPVCDPEIGLFKQ